MGHEDHEHEHAHAHAHEHEHEHEHEHAHEHEHEHVKSGKKVMRADLPFQAGKGKILFLDAPSGLAGDMIIASLIDLGVPPRAIGAVLESLPISGYHLHLSGKERSGVLATHFDVHVEDAQPERTFAAIKKILDASTIPDPVRARAHRIFQKLAEGESAVHKLPLDEVHFHEVGAVDAIVDIVGAAAALEYLGADMVVSPLPMGRGFVNARHGKLPLPAPATVECLRGFATYDGGLDFEFVTPTGAAIVAANALRSERWPSMTPEVVGWGAGTAELADRPNLLRAVLGTPLAARTEEGTHVVLEANLDDASGELLGAAIETLLTQGALDAWATPITMKKGRPAVTLAALATLATADALTAVMLRETTTLGVRRLPVSRTERPRRTVEVATKYGKIPVKVGEGPYGPPQIKPEFDACVAAAREHGVAVKDVLAAVMAAALASIT